MITRKGHSTVELALLIPLFVMLISLGTLFGTQARLISHGSTTLDDFLRFPDDFSWDLLVSSRVREGPFEASEVEWMWRLQHGATEVGMHVFELTSQENGYSVEEPTSQTGEYSFDQIGLKEEVVRLYHSEAQVVWTPDDDEDLSDDKESGAYYFSLNPASLWLSAHGGSSEGSPHLSGTEELLEERSAHRSVEVDVTIEPWLSHFISENSEETSTLTIHAHRRSRLFNESSDWLFYDNPYLFHADFDAFMARQDNISGTLQPTPYWTLLKRFEEAK